MSELAEDADWKGLYELLNDLIREKNTLSLLDDLFYHIGQLVPADSGVAFFDFIDGIPYCRRCTDYPSGKVKEFNNYYNRIAPVIFNPDTNKLGPINWKKYKNIEYDTDFNIPMNIGYSLGCGFLNESLGTFHIIVLNRTRHSSQFKDRDIMNYSLLIGLFSELFNRKEELEFCEEKMISKVELMPGNIPLSRREAEVCQMLCHRWSMKEIADSLHISPRTIECHCLHIYQKLNVFNRTELARLLIS